MAKVYSHSESRAKGSVGMTTYRYVRGKVVQSQKIAPWDPAIDQVGNATRWNERTALMGIISLWCSVHSESIKHSFNRTKGGSQRNYFVKRNYKALAAAFASLAQEYAFTRTAPSVQAIEDAMGSYAAAHANTIYRVKKTGYDVQFLSGNWDDADDPIAAVTVSDIVATLDSDFNMVSLAIVGENLAGEIKIKLAGADVSGNIVIAPNKQSATFTPSNAPLVVGNQSLAVLIGSRVLYTETIEGDQRTYYTLGLSVSPAGGGSVSGAGSYPAGTVVPISATPATGMGFVDWSDGDTNASRSITLNSNMSLTANFSVPTNKIQIAGNPTRVTLNGTQVTVGQQISIPVGGSVELGYTGDGINLTLSGDGSKVSFAADASRSNSSAASAFNVYARAYDSTVFTLTITPQD